MSIIHVELQAKCDAIYISAKERNITTSKVLYHIYQLVILASIPKHIPESPLFLDQIRRRIVPTMCQYSATGL